MTSKQPKALLLAVLTAVFAAFIYWLTLAPDLTWSHFGGDGGELITAAVTLGVPHPPGYPTYVLLGNLISRLPLGGIAYRFNVWTAVCTAVAAAFVTVTALNFPQKSSKQWPGAVAAGLTFAFLPLVWNQALITEVYGLNLLFLSACLWALLTNRSAWVVGLLWGLALTTHLTAVILLPLIFITTSRNQWLKIVGGLFVGLSPFLLLPLLAQSPSPVVWGNPTTLPNWWWLVSGALYRPNLFSLPPTEWFNRASAWLLILWLPLFTLGLMGLWAIKVTAGKERQKLLMLLLTAVFMLIYAFTYQTSDALVFSLPAHLCLIYAAVPTFLQLNRAALVLPLISLLLNFNSQNLQSEHSLRPSIEAALNEAPPQAILLTAGSPDIFAFWYFHIVEKQRPDITIVDQTLFQFDWYRERFQQQNPTLNVPRLDNLEAFQVQNEGQRPFCFVEKIEAAQPKKITLSCIEQGH